MEAQQKNIVVTGATKGIGRAVVEELADRGHHLIYCARTASDVLHLNQELKERYPNQEITGYAIDVSLSDDIDRFAGEIQKKWEAADVLINNAGVFTPGSVLEEKEENLDHQWKTNLLSAFRMTRKIIPAMLKKERGHIINMCSIAGLKAYPNSGAYTITKFAMRGFSLSLREELKNRKIRVSTVYPGATWTDSWAGADFPDSRLMEAGDIAKAVAMAIELNEKSVMEEIILRPQLGDL